MEKANPQGNNPKTSNQTGRSIENFSEDKLIVLPFLFLAKRINHRRIRHPLIILQLLVHNRLQYDQNLNAVFDPVHKNNFKANESVTHSLIYILLTISHSSFE